jgi:hypothetical protein
MAIQYIKQRLVSFKDKRQNEDLFALYTAAQNDLAALRTSFVALTAKLDVLTAKLNADAGVTDTNYATNFAATLDPAALELND